MNNPCVYRDSDGRLLREKGRGHCFQMWWLGSFFFLFLLLLTFLSTFLSTSSLPFSPVSMFPPFFTLSFLLNSRTRVWTWNWENSNTRESPFQARWGSNPHLIPSVQQALTFSPSKPVSVRSLFHEGHFSTASFFAVLMWPILRSHGRWRH